MYRAARIVVDPASGVAFGIPSIDDLIALKKCRQPHARDAEDLRYLAVRKTLHARGELP